MKKQLITLLATVTIASAAIGGVCVYKSVASENVSPTQTVVSDGEWTINGLEKTPVYGEKFSLPEATVKIDGEDVSAEVYVCLPSGRNVSDDEILISEAGNYKAVFSVERNGKLYKTERSFSVNAPFISAGAKSSFEYGTYTEYGCESGNTGYLLKIAEREEITFNKLIDFGSLTKNDKLLDLFILPKSQGTADFDRLTMKFTDSADSSVTLTVVLDRVSLSKWPGSDSLSYVKAAGNGQEITGVESYGSSTEKIHVNDEWGVGIPVSFTAMNDQSKVTIVPSQMSFSLSFDKDENVVKARGVVVTDLDDSKYYKTLWTGFPSGKAKLSLSASGYNSDTADIVVTDVFGLDFSETTVTDETAPIITVNTDYETLPDAKVGAEYKIPDASAIDDYSGLCEVLTKVVYAYGTDKAATIKIKNGEILPVYAGVYTVLYTAVDGYGNTSEKSFSFEAKNELSDIEVNVPEYGEYLLGDTLNVIKANATGGSGRIDVAVKVTCDDEEKAIVNGKVKLDTVGDWQILYTATDYIGNIKEKSVTLSVNKPDKPVFVSRPTLPEVMVDGSGYIIPEYYAEDYSSGKCELKLCDVTVTDALGKKKMASGERYVARVNENGDFVTFVYECDGEKSSEEIKIPVIVPKTQKNGKNVLDMRKYFYGTDFETSASSTDVTITATENGDIGWTFGNALLAEIFSIDFHTIPDKSNFDGLKVTLCDASDKENSISAILTYKRGKTYLSVGETSIEISGGFGLFTATTIKLEYSSKTFKVGNVEIAVEKNDNGSGFTGFSSDKANLSVVMLGAKKGAAYDVRAINLHKFGSNSADYTEPAVYVSGKYGGSYDLGETYVLPRAFAGDVLSPETELILNVYAPNGQIARDVNGKKLENVDPAEEYEIMLDSYGQYRVEYIATEKNWWGRSKPFQYMITVYDGEAPEILFTEEIKRVAKVGEVYSLPKFDVKDNVTAADKIVVGKYVVNPEGKVIKIAEDSFSFNAKGKYIFRIIAIDEQGNTAIKEIAVQVTEG